MDRRPSRSSLAASCALLLILAEAACSVPLAPGYRTLKESREVSFTGGGTPAVRVTLDYILENSGTTDLPFIDINFPDEKLYGMKDLLIRLDGRPVQLQNLPDEYQASAPRTRRMQLDAVWKRGEKHEMAVAYTFSSPLDFGSRITIGPQDFHFGSRGWLAILQPPKHFLSPYPSRPARMNYAVRVPSDFLILARGKQVGQRREGAETAHRFELRPEDLTVFVVAGHYIPSAAEGKAATAIFWTFQPLKENPAPAAERIMSAWNLLEKDFGPLDKNIRVPHVVETTGLRNHLTNESGPAAVAFPGGALVDGEALALGIGSEDFLDRVMHALAHNWFGDEVFFAPDAAVGMGEGLPEYATIVIEEGEKGDAGRRQRILRYINEYDRERSGRNETPLGITMMSDPIDQRRIALAKAPLFFVALEDACGEGPMRSGLKNMVTLLRGQETSYDALRAALEESSGKNLGELFRVWLNDKGIPGEFRSRYQDRAANQ